MMQVSVMEDHCKLFDFKLKRSASLAVAYREISQTARLPTFSE